jgi:hypothetical protein
MADTKQTEPIVRTVASITREGRGPQTHDYDDCDIGPVEFLLRVMRSQHLPMSVRIAAASAALPYTSPRPNTNSFHIGCRIIIPHMSELFEREGEGPRTLMNGSGTEAHEQINSEIHSNSLSASKTYPAQSEAPAPVNLTRDPDPSPFIDYSSPPTPAELQEIKAAINRLRPDLAHLPVPEPHLRACGHWIFGPCPLGERCCDRTKLN